MINQPNSILYTFFEKNGLRTAGVMEEVMTCFEEKEIARNAFHLKEGTVSNEYMIVENGFLRSFTHDTEGNEVTTNFFASGGLVLEVASFFHRTPSKENVQALTDSKGWVITFEKLNMLFHRHQAFRETGRSVLVRGFAALKERMLSMINETAEQRYIALLQTNPDIFQQAPLKYIASYLGVTDTSLSRIRKEISNKH
ncbi:MAG: Crp/Fnr family transcriptional regulator [Chitinophagaceae bacterium]|nr:MAG: Crp/Fnr family transcriptional regulator [Chitinophagaceae bacterium]